MAMSKDKGTVENTTDTNSFEMKVSINADVYYL